MVGLNRIYAFEPEQVVYGFDAADDIETFRLWYSEDNDEFRFRHQYAEFLRELFEMGIPVTYGSDSHDVYAPDVREAEKYLLAAGFRDGDIGEVKDCDLW